MVTYTYTYTNKEKKHQTGDILSTNISRTVPKPGINATPGIIPLRIGVV